jgi:23S rRNA pseudouridine1911/1915/1917 synthase
MDALVAMIARAMSPPVLALAHGAWRGRMREVRGHRPRPAQPPAHGGGRPGQRQAGKPARPTSPAGSAEQACLVRGKLHTGRTHQIRVHMASLGHPLLADALYGGTPLAGMERQALHAYRLGFEHPITGQEVLVQHAAGRFHGGHRFLGAALQSPPIDTARAACLRTLVWHACEGAPDFPESPLMNTVDAKRVLETALICAHSR